MSGFEPDGGSIDDLKTADREAPGLFRPGFVAAAAFLVLVIGVGVAVVFSDGGGKTSATPPPPSATSPVAPASSAPPAGSGCNPAGSGQQVPTAPLPNVTWDLWNGIAEPVSSTDGPAQITGDIARCYAHTPAGALIAAMQISERHLLSPDWKNVTLQQVAPGPGRDKYIANRGNATIPPATGTYPQWAGFNIVTYTDSTAVVQLAVRFPDGGYQMTTDTVVWSGSDWKVQLQPDGSDSPSAQQLPNLVGFVVWGGV